VQSLSVDESVWFDHLFLSIICPIFYVETLADLGKSFGEGKNPDKGVSIISDKVPEMHSNPCMHHKELCLSNLFKHPVPMSGQIPLAGGYPVKVDGHSGIVFKQTPEAKAFSRWQDQQFYELERDFARQWRESVSQFNLKGTAQRLKEVGLDSTGCRSLDEVAKLSKSFIDARGSDFRKISLLCSFQGFGRKEREGVLAKWRRSGCQPLRTYAPYAAWVLEVDLFFYYSLQASLISTERPSNRVDIAYLYYLPFAHVFVSSDKLHRNCAQALWKNGSFVWGVDLKAELKTINDHFSSMSIEERERGVMSIQNGPPDLTGSLVVSLWDKWVPLWRQFNESRRPSPKDNSNLVKQFNCIANAPPLCGREASEVMREYASMTLQRVVSAKKGSWWQLPKDVVRGNRGGV